MLRWAIDTQILIHILSCLIIFLIPSFSTALTTNNHNNNTQLIPSLNIISASITFPSHIKDVSISSSKTVSAKKILEPTLGAISSSPPVPAYPYLQCNNNNNNNNNGSTTDCDIEDLPLLSELLLQNVLEQYPDVCNATILANGFINLINNTFNSTDNDNRTTILKNATLTYPSLLIQCSNDTLSDRPYHATHNNFTQFLVDIANNYTLDKVNDDSTAMVYKDDFTESVLLIIFSQTALCVAAWMLFLVLLLLPSSNYNNRNILVHFYVLFYAIVQSYYLGKAYSTTFKFQYDNCIQDATRYHNEIIHLTSHKILEVVINILSGINWFYMVIFMYKVDVSRNTTKDNNTKNDMTTINPRLPITSRKNKYITQCKNWIFNSKYPHLTHIIIIGTILLVINNVFYAVVIWNYSRLSSRVINKTTELLIYTLLVLCMVTFILRNFGMTIASTKQLESLNLDDNNSMLNFNHQTYTGKTQTILFKSKVYWKRFQKWISVIWKDYHDTIPLLIYNILVFILSFYMTIYFTAKHYYVHRWKYNLLHFTKLLITVNFWGLIGVFRRREIFLNKKTVIGRKINNKDKFFIDPTVNYDLNRSSSTLSSDRGSEMNDSSSNTNHNTDLTSPAKKAKKFSLVKPLHSVISKFNTTKQRRTRFATENKVQENWNNKIGDPPTHSIVQGASYNHNDTQSILFESSNDDKTSMTHGLLLGISSYDNANVDRSYRNNTCSNDQDLDRDSNNDSEDTELESNYIFNTL